MLSLLPVFVPLTFSCDIFLMTGASSTHEDSLSDVENRVRENIKLEVDDNENFRFSIWISYAEIYNEQIYDLLVPLSKKNVRRPTLKICDDRGGSPYIKGIYHRIMCRL